MERHVILLPHGQLGDDDDTLVSVAKTHAERYALAHGFEIVRLHGDVYGPLDGAAYGIGVSFDLVVGKGDIAYDQRVPGALDAWRWSGPRMEFWRRLFNRTNGRQGRRIVARQEGEARVIPFDRGGLRHPMASGFLDGLEVSDQRPPNLRRGEGWDEDGPEA
jgi:hypothetical protein